MSHIIPKKLLNKIQSQFDFWKLTVDEITELKNAYIQTIKNSKKELLSVSATERTFDNTVVYLSERMGGDFENVPAIFSTLVNISLDETIREAARLALDDLGKYALELLREPKIYEAVKLCKNMVPKNAGAQKLYSDLITGFEREGFHLPRPILAKIVKLQKQLVGLTSQFQANIAKDRIFIESTESELEGLPVQMLSSFDRQGDKILVPNDTSIAKAVFRYVQSREYRIKYFKQYSRRGGRVNLKLLKKAIAVRSKLAETLGYASFEEYVVSTAMSKKPANIDKLIKANIKGFGRLYNKYEYPRLVQSTAEKELYHKIDTDPFYAQLAQDFSVDPESGETQQYFSLEKVIEVMHSTFEKILGITVSAISQKMWHKEVTVLEVRDSKTKRQLGYLLYDLFPREGKYSHACASPALHATDVQLPAISMIANFTKSKSGPSTLTFQEVTTLFHEFGHLMHYILSSHSEYRSQYGFCTSTDFVEIPSQLFEEWAYSDEVLKKMAIHTVTGVVMSKTMRDKLRTSRYVGIGGMYLRQSGLATLDRSLHVPSNSREPDALWKEIVLNLTHTTVLDDSLFPCDFGHLMGGYEAQYYSYAWSLAIASDMWSVFVKPFDPVQGKKLRVFLEKGDSADELELVTEFLGRKPDFSVFANTCTAECDKIYSA